MKQKLIISGLSKIESNKNLTKESASKNTSHFHIQDNKNKVDGENTKLQAQTNGESNYNLMNSPK